MVAHRAGRALLVARTPGFQENHARCASKTAAGGTRKGAKRPPNLTISVILLVGIERTGTPSLGPWIKAHSCPTERYCAAVDRTKIGRWVSRRLRIPRDFIPQGIIPLIDARFPHGKAKRKSWIWLPCLSGGLSSTGSPRHLFRGPIVGCFTFNVNHASQNHC